MSAAARAEARKKAILARGNDRLAKLTSSARGEDSPYNSPPPTLNRPSSAATLKTESFLGEDTPIHTPQLRPSNLRADSEPPPTFASATNASGPRQSTPDPGVWSTDQQQQLLAALMGGAGVGGAAFPGLSPPSYKDSANDPPLPNLPGMENNPLAAMFGQQGMPFPPAAQVVAEPPKKTTLQKLMPVIHLFSMWGLLIFFAFWHEPNVYEASGGTKPSSQRWATLLSENSSTFSLGILSVPFFYAFVTIQLILHSLHIFVGYDTVTPPTILSMVLPHLPPPVPSVILQGMKYWKMCGAVLDDLAILLVTLGLGVWIVGYWS